MTVDSAEKRSRSEYLWPLSTLANGARGLTSYGFSYCGQITSSIIPYVYAGTLDNIFSSISSAIGLSGASGPFSEIPAEVANIRNTASFQLILGTARDVLASIWHFCLGRGPVFDSAAARGPLMSAVCVIMRISYYMLLASFLYLIPTIAIALFFIGIIYFNFGGPLSFISASCMAAYLTLNFALKTWGLTRTEGQPDADEDPKAVSQSSLEANHVKGLLVASESSIKSLADSLPSSSCSSSTAPPPLLQIQPESDANEVSDSAAAPSYTSPLRSAMQWHLGLFKFYDRLLQALVKRPDEPEHEKAE